MYTNLYVYKPPRLFMAGKLYWRIKKDGKWTWKAVPSGYTLVYDNYIPPHPMEEEE